MKTILLGLAVVLAVTLTFNIERCPTELKGEVSGEFAELMMLNPGSTYAHMNLAPADICSACPVGGLEIVYIKSNGQDFAAREMTGPGARETTTPPTIMGEPKGPGLAEMEPELPSKDGQDFFAVRTDGPLPMITKDGELDLIFAGDERVTLKPDLYAEKLSANKPGSNYAVVLRDSRNLQPNLDFAAREMTGPGIIACGTKKTRGELDLIFAGDERLTRQPGSSYAGLEKLPVPPGLKEMEPERRDGQDFFAAREMTGPGARETTAPPTITKDGELDLIFAGDERLTLKPDLYAEKLSANKPGSNYAVMTWTNSEPGSSVTSERYTLHDRLMEPLKSGLITEGPIPVRQGSETYALHDRLLEPSKSGLKDNQGSTFTQIPAFV